MKPTEYNWLYLCCDPRKLALTLRYLPKVKPVGLRYAYICFPGHQADIGRQLTNVAFQHAPEWLVYSVQDVSVDAARVIPAGLGEYLYGSPGQRPNWAIGAILALPCIFTGPFLYTDDDVLLLEDPQRLIDGYVGRGWGATNMLSKVPDYVVEGLAKTFDLVDFTADSYAVHRLGGGVWFVDDTRDWRERLEVYAQQPYVRELLTQFPDRWETRRFTQRFLTGFGYRYGFAKVTSALDVKTVYQTVDKFRLDSCVTGRVFFHYAVPHPHKDAWVTALENRLERI